ncbi:MAG: hypothetical protein HYT03_01725 [Candidatus Harrisonbacteria bacterium]|nr:hypothetical protein [Candidatus Harrisonbacteria bacterium]
MGAEHLNRFRFYTWKEFETDVKKISKIIGALDQKFVYIYGLPKGGLPLAVCLAHRLELRLTTTLRFKEGLSIVWHDEVLVVDDIADTGRALENYKKLDYLIATLFWNPKSSFRPDIWIREKDNRWIIFPWEDREKEMAHAEKIMNPDAN